MTTKQKMARKLHAEITANVDAYYADAKDNATFSRDNVAIWDRATIYGVAPLVSALMWGDMAAFEAADDGNPWPKRRRKSRRSR